MKRRAFTLIELLVVIAIIGLLTTIAIVSLTTARSKGRIAAGQQSDVAIYQGLGDQIIGDWSLNETGGTTILDASGNGNNGTLNGTLTSVVGVFGNALSFDGSTNFIQIANPISITLNSFTVTAWFETTSAADQKIFSSDVSNHYIQTLSGSLRVCTHNVCAPIGSRKINDGNWHFAVVTGDAVSTRGYVDGGLEVTQTASSSTITSSGTTIGAVGGGNTLKFQGLLDQVRLYSGAMTAQAIEKLYAEGLSRHVARSSLRIENK